MSGTATIRQLNREREREGESDLIFSCKTFKKAQFPSLSLTLVMGETSG